MKAFCLLVAFVLVMLTAILAATILPSVFAQTGERTVQILIPDVYGAPGELVDLPISFNTQDQDVRLIEFEMAFNGLVFPISTGTTGAAAFPTGWIFQAFEAAPGDLRFIATDLSGDSAISLEGHIFSAQLQIGTDAPPGVYAITTGLVVVATAPEAHLPVSVRAGSVTVVDLRPNTVVGHVLPARPLGIAITPAVLTGQPGETQQMEARLIRSDFSEELLTPDKVAWTSSDPTVATVSSTGMVTFVKPGPFVIRPHYTP